MGRTARARARRQLAAAEARRQQQTETERMGGLLREHFASLTPEERAAFLADLDIREEVAAAAAEIPVELVDPTAPIYSAVAAEYSGRRMAAARTQPEQEAALAAYGIGGI